MLAGCFSPIAVYGLTALQLFDEEGIAMPAGSGAYLMGATVATGLLLTAVYVIASRRHLPRNVEVGAEPAALATDAGTPTSSRRDRISTLAAMAVLVVAGVGFNVDLGYLGFTLAVILQLTLGMDPQQIVTRIPWGVVVLISGVLTYIGVMEQAGAFDLIKDVILIDGSPLIGLLLLCYICGVTSFFASSIAVLATVVPLLLPLIDAGVSPVGALLAVGLACLLVDVNPLGITGGLFLASAKPEERSKLFRRLLVFGCCSTVVAPALVWALFSWF